MLNQPGFRTRIEIRIFIFISLNFLSVFFAEVSIAQDSIKRQVTIPWAPVEDAVGYELEIIGDRIHKSKKPKLELSLLPGLYQFRLRTLDPNGEKGPWSPKQALRVPPKEIDSVKTDRGEIYRFGKSRPDINISWDGPQNYSGTYQVVLKDSDGRVIQSEITKKSSWAFKGLPEGRYTWAVFPNIEGLDLKSIKTTRRLLVEKIDLKPPQASTKHKTVFKGGAPVTLKALKVDYARAYGFEVEPLKPFFKREELLEMSKSSTPPAIRIEKKIRKKGLQTPRLEKTMKPGRYRWRALAFEKKDSEPIFGPWLEFSVRR